MEWYRAYHGMPHDLKLKVVAKRSGQPMAHVVAVWVCLLDAASQHRSRGTVEVDAEQIARVREALVQLASQPAARSLPASGQTVR